MQGLVDDIKTAFAALPFLSWRGIALAMVAGGAATLALSFSGLDATINALAAEHQNRTASIAWSAIPLLGGMIVPVLLALWASLTRQGKDCAAAAWLAFGLSLGLVTVLKALTGRVHPEALLPADLYERSTSFSIGLMNGGIVEGWPSGHAAVNGAVCLAIALTHASPLARRLAISWAVWVWLAVTFGIQGEVHWLSDAVAGGLLGTATAFAAARAVPLPTRKDRQELKRS